MRNCFIKKVLILSIFFQGIFFIPILCFADNTNGSVSGIALRQSTGARPFAMGGAYVAVSDDLNALFWNPAGLASITKRELSAMYFKGLSDVYTGFLGYATPIGEKGKDSIGVGLLTLQGGKILVNYMDGSSHSFNAQQDYVAVLSYARDFSDGFLLGGSLKVLHSTLVEEYTAETFAVDLGLMYKLMEDDLKFGIACQNLGGGIEYSQEKDTLPLSFKGGVFYRIKKEDYISIYDEPLGERTFPPGLILSLEVEKPMNAEVKEKIGFEYGEYWKEHRYVLRGGYKIGYDLDSFTGGIGCEFREFQIDYGIGMMEDLGFMHKVSLTIRFPSIVKFDLD